MRASVLKASRSWRAPSRCALFCKCGVSGVPNGRVPVASSPNDCPTWPDPTPMQPRGFTNRSAMSASPRWESRRASLPPASARGQSEHPPPDRSGNPGFAALPAAGHRGGRLREAQGAVLRPPHRRPGTSPSPRPPERSDRAHPRGLAQRVRLRAYHQRSIGAEMHRRWRPDADGASADPPPMRPTQQGHKEGR